MTLLDYDGDARFDLDFPSNLIASASNLVRFSLAVLLTFFKSLKDGYCFCSAIWSLDGTNSLINFLILRISLSLGLFFNHEFYRRFPGLTIVYSNSKTVNKVKQ